MSFLEIAGHAVRVGPGQFLGRLEFWLCSTQFSLIKSCCHRTVIDKSEGPKLNAFYSLNSTAKDIDLCDLA